MPQSSLSIRNTFKIYKHNFLHLFRFLEPGGCPMHAEKSLGWREQRRDMITCAKSVKIGLSGFKSVLGIRPLLETLGMAKLDHSAFSSSPRFGELERAPTSESCD